MKLYLRHGETFNGDGTSPDAATVGGGVGAFNDMATCFAGTQVGIASDDVLHVFTGGNPSWAITGSWSFAGRYMVFDAGVEFGGVFAEFTFAGTGTLTFDNSNIIGNNACRITQDSSSHANNNFSYCNWSNVHYEDIATANHAGWRRSVVNYSSFDNVTCTLVGFGAKSTVQTLFYLATSGSSFRFSNLVINWNTTKTAYLFNQTNSAMYGNNLTVNNDISGLNMLHFSGRCNHFLNGLHTENGLMDIHDESLGLSVGTTVTISNITKGGDGFYDSYNKDYHATVQTRIGLNYPALNAFTVDINNTQYSARVIPYLISRPSKLISISKFDTLGGTREIKVNLLLPDDYLTVTKYDYFINISYIDSSDTPQTANSEISGELLDTSTANWTASVYGAVTFNKYEIAVAGLDIKPNSIISVELITDRPKINADDFYFIDPEIELT